MKLMDKLGHLKPHFSGCGWAGDGLSISAFPTAPGRGHTAIPETICEYKILTRPRKDPQTPYFPTSQCELSEAREELTLSQGPGPIWPPCLDIQHLPLQNWK